MHELQFQSKWFFRCQVDILIVADATIGFGSAGFDLGQVLTTLNTDPWSHVKFNVTKAHRQSSNDADVTDNFRFDTHDLTQYSQIWLFGFNDDADSLEPAELKAVSQFMDNGGGMFATGDHRDLGKALCAEIPRVRSMRRWHHPDPGPDGAPVAPGQGDATRMDTVMMPGTQSDAIPQPIRPRWYTRKVGGSFFYRVEKHPHPVLCGPSGTIQWLPDHMHEGVCEVPSNLSKTFTFDGYATDEYPSASGHQEAPQVIAWATDRNSGGAEFGVIGAYDGHRVGVGRVVVDATWHHWFNINLDGLANASNPSHPSYDAAVVSKWSAIQAYFRNVGVWLARQSVQTCVRNGGWLIATKAYEVLELRTSLSKVRNKLGYYHQLGTTAKDALGRIASQCQTTKWVLETLRWPELIQDPWWILPRPLPDPPPWLDIQQLETVALGSAIHALSEKFGTARSFEKLVYSEEQKVTEVAQRGAIEGARELLSRHSQCGAQAEKLLGSMRSESKPVPV